MAPKIFKDAIIALGYAVRPVNDARSVEDCMDGQFGARLPDAPRAAGYGSRHFSDHRWCARQVTVCSENATILCKRYRIKNVDSINFRVLLLAGDPSTQGSLGTCQCLL